jgi:hypothetical protein
MRAAAKTLLLVALAAPLAGCEWLRKFAADKDATTPTQTGPIAAVSPGELVAYLNKQAALLNSVRYPDVSISVTMGKEHHTLGDSTLICAKPRNFLLVGGKKLTGDLVQIGSNDREFWLLTKSPLEPTYVYCSHADFQYGRGQLPIPFDPDWALEALGMATYDTSLPYKVDTDQRLKVHTLSVDTTTPQGVRVRKEVVMEPNPPGNRPHIRTHRVLDSAGKVIAVADVKEMVQVPAGGAYVQVPTRVVLEWPQQQTKMELTLGRPKVNESMTDAEAARMFNRPQPAGGVNPVNLADARFVPSSARGATPDDRPRRGR